jgi:translation initiation factor RLI1
MQKCPFDAILIINLPRNLAKETTHRYGVNSFKLHRYCQLAAWQREAHVNTSSCSMLWCFCWKMRL